MQQMYDQIGTPEDAKRSEQMWNERLFKIEERLKMYPNSHLSSSPDSQVSSTPTYT